MHSESSPVLSCTVHVGVCKRWNIYWDSCSDVLSWCLSHSEALHLVSTAANHANEAMKKIDKFKQLLEVQEKISGAVDLVSPTRELLKEGKIVKISARSGDHQERYLFLVSVSSCILCNIFSVVDWINILEKFVCWFINYFALFIWMPYINLDVQALKSAIPLV